MTLVSIPRARQLPTLASVDAATLSDLIDSSSNAAENYCQRKFGLATYDELLNGTNTRSLFVSNPPIVNLIGVRWGLNQAATITNSTQNLEVATVEVGATAITLRSTFNGTTTTTILAYGTYATFTTLAAAINALGNGWACHISNQFANWSTADLAAYGVTYSARNLSCQLMIHWQYVNGYQVKASSGELFYSGGWTGGYQAYRVKYTGGFATVPPEVQEAVCELVQATYLATKANPNMQSETLDKYSYTKAATNGIANLSLASRQTLGYYKIHKAPFWRA
jgi:hypothetical protein